MGFVQRNELQRLVPAKFANLPGRDVSKLIENHCIIMDPYHGKIELRWDSKYIWGTINLDDADLRSAYLHQIKQGFDSINLK